MPGMPDPVLGSDPLTAVFAAVIGIFVVATFVYAARALDVSAIALTGAGVILYGLFAAGLWADVRLLFYELTLMPTGEPARFAWLLIVAGALLAVQAAIPFFLFANSGFVTPMAGLAAISAFLFFTFLRVGGETDPLALFGVGFGPFFIAGLVLLAALEAGARYLFDGGRSEQRSV